MGRDKAPAPTHGISYKLTFEQMLTFRDAFPHFKGGKEVKEVASTAKTTEGKIKSAFGNIGEGLGLTREECIEQSQQRDSQATATGQFYEKLVPLLDKMLAIKPSIQWTPQRVIVGAGELMLLWFLPRVLGRTKLLEQSSKMTLDLHRMLPQEGMRSLALGNIHLLLGANASEKLPPGIDRHKCPIMRVQCGLIFHRRHSEAVGVDPEKIQLHDLSAYPIFLVRQEAAADYPLEKLIREEIAAKKLMDARLVYVDSNAYIYNYVSRGIGVGLYYEPGIHPFDAVSIENKGDDRANGGSEIVVKMLEHPFPVADFHVFWRNDQPLSKEAEALKEAIIAFAEERRAGHHS